MNVIAGLEYELAYYDSAVHRFNHYTTWTPTPLDVWDYRPNYDAQSFPTEKRMIDEDNFYSGKFQLRLKHWKFEMGRHSLLLKGENYSWLNPIYIRSNLYLMYQLLYIADEMNISYLLTPPLGQDMTQGPFFKWSLTGLNSEFSFSKTSCLTKAEEPSLPYYLPIAGGRIIGFIPFPRELVLCEMQSVSSRIWTRVAVSISCDDNHYTTGTPIMKWICNGLYLLIFLDINDICIHIYK